ncbi:MAG TPA: SigB/SigF/SigG family RNA polymerase sigma factor, partial [Tissierellales bacterium]|nr:SigB/SigF/SigG family RNA polymerase sigma factor [Tissierellales bacterium]
MNKQVHYKDKENINYEKLDNETLFKIYKETQDNDIRELLIEKNLYIAEILSKKYVNRGIDYDDIFQVASIGLIYAVDRFDIDKGYKFSSFATPTIIGEIKKHFRDKGWTIRVPRRIQELSKKINNAKIHLNQKLQHAPTVDDIAEYLKSTPEEILEAMEASKVYTPQSLDLTYDSSTDDKDVNLSDLIGVEDEHFDRIENKDLLIKGTKDLNDMEKKILIDRYFNLKTQVSIAEELGISQMTVSRMEKRVIEKIQKELKK